MSLLSSPLSELKTHYDVVIVGSGYGGSISASRLARATKADGSKVSVCLLERGKEIPVGRFPDKISEAGHQFQIDAEKGHVGNKTGFYDMRQNDNINVFQGCGLGGTSLVNANVSLRAEDWVWEDPAWPKAIRNDRAGGVEAGYKRAEAMLRPNPYPNDPPLSKNEMHKKSAEAMGKGDCFYNPPINVAFESGINHVGVEQEACNGCGDCVSGCNVGSKNTLMRNYLPDAKNWGAEIFCGVKVRRIAVEGEKTFVYYEPLESERCKFNAPEMFVTADVVIISAGTLGSAEIMLRSKSAGLKCSGELGNRFTGNGDVLGFGYNTDHRINGVGMGDREVDPEDPVGPCITSVIDLRKSYDNPEDGFVIEEGSIPGALAPVLAAAFATAADMAGKDTDEGVWDGLKETARKWKSLGAHGAYRGAVANTQIYLIMSHDDGQGKLELENDRVRIVWPELGRQRVFKRTNDALFEATKGLGGTYTPSPTFTKLFGYELVTVHPLGGCCMGEKGGSGVVNHKGQVFTGGGEEVYDNVYISDGSVIPRPVGVNPLFTISAVSERNIYLLAGDRGWTVDESWRDGKAEFDGSWEPDDKLIVQFTERMAGHCSTEILDDYEAADKDGKAKDQECSFILTIHSDDLDRMIKEKAHEAAMIGTVECPVLSSQALTVSNGRFNLFSPDEDDPLLKKMQYRFNLTSVEGKRYYFAGFKKIKNDKGPDVWPDTTTLYITIHEGEDESGPVVVKGMLYIAVKDFVVQMTTMEAFNSEGKKSIKGTAEFGSFFAGELWDTYGAESLIKE